MIGSKFHTSYLLRATLLQLVILAVWWLALVDPLLFLLRTSAGVLFRLLPGGDSAPPISVDGSGNWNFHIPVEGVIPDAAQRDRMVKISSIDFTVARSDLILFTFPLPVFWAVTLAAGLTKSGIRAVLQGTVVVSLVNVLLLLAFAEINARRTVLQMNPSPDRLALWLTELAHHVAVNVMPFAAPLLVAIAIHPGLRDQLFSSKALRKAGPG